MTNNNQLSSNPLQLKMPMVGRKYKLKQQFDDYETIRVISNYKQDNGLDCVAFIYIDQKATLLSEPRPSIGDRSLSDFWYYYEELPNQDNEDGKKQIETEKKKGEEKSDENCYYCYIGEDRVGNHKYELRNAANPNEKAKEQLRSHIKEWGNSLIKNYDDSVVGLVKYSKNLLNVLDESNIPEKGDCGIWEDAREAIISKECHCCQKALGMTALVGGFCSVDCSLKYDKKADISNTGNASSELVKDKPKSIWKPVSELPEFNKSTGYPEVIVKFWDGNIRFGVVMARQLYDIHKQHKFKNIKEFCLLADYITHNQEEKDELRERVERLEQKEK